MAEPVSNLGTAHGELVLHLCEMVIWDFSLFECSFQDLLAHKLGFEHPELRVVAVERCPKVIKFSVLKTNRDNLRSHAFLKLLADQDFSLVPFGKNEFL
jgi:hypothetical protein